MNLKKNTLSTFPSGEWRVVFVFFAVKVCWNPPDAFFHILYFILSSLNILINIAKQLLTANNLLNTIYYANFYHYNIIYISYKPWFWANIHRLCTPCRIQATVGLESVYSSIGIHLLKCYHGSVCSVTFSCISKLFSKLPS